MKDKPCALILSGGGARAAYQVGVLKAISLQYSRKDHVPFKILCGTSAGGINSTALACYASCFRLGVKKLDYIWRNFSTEQVYKTQLSQLALKLSRQLLAGMQTRYANKIGFSLLDHSPLRTLLQQSMDFERIDRNILRGAIQAAAITASDYSSGDSITFYQSNGLHPPWQRSKRKGLQVLINSEHLMATSAIPLIFPPCQIGQDYYGDGSVHQLAPLSPAIHLGAEKIFVISLDQPQQKHPIYATPGLSEISGHLLDTIFSDTLNADLERLHRINATIDQLPQGASSKLKSISSFVIKPSKNFNQIAAKYFPELPFTIKMLLASLGINQNSQSSLVSYLLFEQNYTRELIALGQQDAQNNMAAIMAFLQQ